MILSTTREATSCAATQELPGILWNLKVHYCITSTGPYPEPEQSNPYQLY
jgi:hypothetical protein